ncbi:hypothetical protein F480_02475 [Bibersteinia trehalosi Y31]|uniref:DUF2971 domain-containing protein n=1 Tax=Bibersteinia trehalosi Y31 TaxID=1261658 RepID=A0A179D142_BIBTR|nr:DUF2971 domain-containing protein [Bibersteinia trehalosi]OAQ15812.1 hypothetical protein F480_02475 [Bibersteinia trehalosi Y31]
MNFYKYMAFRKEFFEELMIRATPAQILNDPFELKFTKEQLRQYQKNRGIDSSDDDINETIGIVQLEYEDLGVISFSENYDNNVMWSHYANEHSGVVVQFCISKEIGFFTNNIGCDVFGDVHIIPQPVKYSKNLPNFEIIDRDNKKQEKFPYKKFNETILLHKSFDWSYEQELRMIVRLRDADKIIFSLNSKNKDELERIKEECKRDKRIKIYDKDPNHVTITYPVGFEGRDDDIGDQSIKFEIYMLTKHLNPIHLFRINKECIKSVFLGCKFKDERSLNSKVINSDFYKMRIDENTYSLTPSLFDFNSIK